VPTDLIYEKHAYLFEQEKKDLSQLGARVLSREIKPILDKNVFFPFLKENTNNSLATSALTLLFREESDSEISTI
jgi:hypothetical protein